jgi:UTP--glucose-1-phosphate uridylyltransferase
MHVLPASLQEALGRLFGDTDDPGAVDLRSALAELARTERYLATELDGQRYDFGLRYGLLTAQLALSLSGVDRDEVLSNLLELMATRLRDA